VFAGRAIDSHEVVMRINQAPTNNKYHRHVGSRCVMIHAACGLMCRCVLLMPMRCTTPEGMMHDACRTTFRLINTRWANKYGDVR
jgi:hypothetical protein